MDTDLGLRRVWVVCIRWWTNDHRPTSHVTTATTYAEAEPALDIGKFLADLDWWFTLKGISGVEAAQADVLKGYLGDRKPHQPINERFARASLFYALILTKIVLRRVPIYKKEWAAQVLEKAVAV